MSLPGSTACPGCGATYAAAPPVCLICGHAFASAQAGPAPPTPAAKPRRRGRLRKLFAIVSLFAGLCSSGLGLARVLSGTAPPREAPTTRPAPSAVAAHPARAQAVGAHPASTPAAAPAARAVAAHHASTPGAAPVPPAAACSNDVFGYSLRYQAPWVASSATPEQTCALFDTAPIAQAELLAASRAGVPVDAPIQITPYARASTYDDAVIDIHNHKGIDAGDTIDLGVGNTFGERIMAVVTNPDGSHSHLFAYLFSLRGKPFLAAAYEPLSSNFAQTVRALDRMMRTLRVQ